MKPSGENATTRYPLASGASVDAISPRSWYCGSHVMATSFARGARGASGCVAPSVASAIRARSLRSHGTSSSLIWCL